MKIEIQNIPPQWKEIKILSHYNINGIEEELNKHLDKDWLIVSNGISFEGEYWLATVGKLKRQDDENEY